MSSAKIVPPPAANLDDVNAVAEAVFFLAKELRVLTDRVYALEQVLESRGVSPASAVASFTPNEAQAAELEAMRSRLIDGVLRSLKAPLPGD
ncbi:MAG: hypothetical protein V4466_15900 [Pseudomonadota bacterium]